jgi:hypothetical protein
MVIMTEVTNCNTMLSSYNPLSDNVNNTDNTTCTGKEYERLQCPDKLIFRPLHNRQHFFQRVVYTIQFFYDLFHYIIPALLLSIPVLKPGRMMFNGIFLNALSYIWRETVFCMKWCQAPVYMYPKKSCPDFAGQLCYTLFVCLWSILRVASIPLPGGIVEIADAVHVAGITDGGVPTGTSR